MRRTLLVGAVLVAALVAVPPATAADGPTVYAHRGGAEIAPENTLGAFRQAHKLFGKQGVWLEMDTQLTSDGVLVVLHDDTLDRTTNCTGAVIEKTAAEVTACDATKTFPQWGSPEPVPTLEQVLREAKKKRWRLSVEIKNIPGESNFDPAGTTVADALVDLVVRVGFLEKRLIVQSFFPTSLDRVEQRAPDIRTALLTTSEFGFLVTENAAYSAARGYEVSSPNFEAPDMNAESVALAHALGVDVVTWTVDDPADIQRISGYGVDGIISDRPDVVYATLG
jgi:glycerophosphoryl diester phosphodiesterase